MLTVPEDASLEALRVTEESIRDVLAAILYINSTVLKDTIHSNETPKSKDKPCIEQWPKNGVFDINLIITKSMNRLVRHFSVINKLKQSQRLRQGNNFERCPTHLFNDQPTPKGTLQTNRHLLSPYQQFLIDTKSLERPFTGKFWAELSTGFYHCAVCDTRLFTFNHKFQSNTGHATFWRHVENRVRTVDEPVNFEDVNDIRAKYKTNNPSYKRCECAQCSSHLGAVFFDGPPPSFLRFTINSALLNFYDMPDFPDPIAPKSQKRRAKKQHVIRYIR